MHELLHYATCCDLLVTSTQERPMTNLGKSIELPKGISQRQVAEHIGISTSTVSRVLSGHQGISDRTRADVQRAIDELMGNSGQQSIPRMIGLTPSNLNRESDARIARTSLHEALEGAESVAHARGFMVYTWANSASLVEDAGSAFFSAVEGVIMVGGVVDLEIVDAIEAQELPIVLAGGALPTRHIPSVGADAMFGATAAIEHFIQLGHTRIALVNGPPSTYTTVEKRAGYLSAHASAGIHVRDEYIVGGHREMGFSEQSGFTETQRLLDLEQPPTAIFYASDALAHGGRAACHARGLVIPRDVSVIGYDDSASAATSVPSLSSIRIDRREWGAKAAEGLLDMLNGDLDSRWRLLMPASLQIRESVGPPPGD